LPARIKWHGGAAIAPRAAVGRTINLTGTVKRVGFAVGDGSLAVACAHRLVSIKR
jgi:hypothetical protein